MLKLSFKQTQAEFMVRIAASLIFNKLVEADFPLVTISDMAENVQYGYTEKATNMEVGPKYVRITDLKDGQINWETVPFCKCGQPEPYLLSIGDLLFARTGATTGKTHLVKETPPKAVFASYLIRLRPQEGINPEYLYSFFQSDLYWEQISNQKEGSAQPNVNGQKLSNLNVPQVDLKLQSSISNFLSAVRLRQDRNMQELPEILTPLEELPRIVKRIESIVARVNEAMDLNDEAGRETQILSLSIRNLAFEDLLHSPTKKLDDICTVVRGSSPRPKGDTRFYGGNIPRLLIADITRDGKYVSPSIDSLTEEGARLSRPMPKGSLVIAISGSYGVPAFLAVDACIHDGFIGFRDIDSSVDPEYLYQVLLLSRPYFDSVVKDSGLKNLTTDHLKNLDIPLPPLDEQRRVVAYLDGLQAKVNALRELQSASGEELSALMPSILDKAFKGELLPSKSALYFAYGSNMKIDRMTKRVPSAKPVGYARLMDKKLVFNKISTDGSGKTNIVDSKNDVVLGVLFEVDEGEIVKLDSVEIGYERQNITVLGNDDQQTHAFTYVSAQTNNDLKPYDWYLRFLVDGAEEHQLPKDYVDYLRSFKSVPDSRKKK